MIPYEWLKALHLIAVFAWMAADIRDAHCGQYQKKRENDCPQPSDVGVLRVLILETALKAGQLH